MSSAATSTLHDKHFPGETPEYRQARNALLQAELELRSKIEQVAELRRQLPMSAAISEDYIFEEGSHDLRDTQTIQQVRLSELFAPNKNSLVLINFMFASDDEVPCTMCNMWADSYDAVAPHVSQQVNFALVAKADIKKLRAWAAGRNWRQIRLLSSLNNNFNRDYLTESDKGQLPSITVFWRDEAGRIHHFYSVEGHFTSSAGDPRHIDLCSPVWNLLDLTPQGRGDNWYPKFAY